MEEKEFDYINMIPFIDVMLVLLTIVLLTSTFVATGIIPIDLPKVTGQYENTEKSTLVEIEDTGTIYYRGRPVSLAALKEEIRVVRKDTPFLVRADKNIPLQTFIEVIDVVKTVGFRNVSVQTEQVVK
ncbi:MAG: Biopolymer transport protein ExbD [Syntrophorhabdus sp. PtaU1.Bin153]|nr:MAG: Biopolymer transport protein ExbD [Syntrophorhabdus sp. PtaU1.Bin153]